MIVINYGNDIISNTYESLQASDIHKYLRREQKVAIKPNLVVPRPASGGATTHAEVVEGIIIFLQEYGIKDISIIESAAIGESTRLGFKNCGYERLAQEYKVMLFDLKDDRVTHLTHSGYQLGLCNRALDADFLINVPVLKSHCQTRMTCCLKNMKGCIPDSEKRRYHTMGLHKPIAALNALIKTHYCVVDGICGDLSFEEGGTPVESKRIIVGANPVLVDSFCAELIGYRPDDIEHLAIARRLGVGEYYNEQTEVVSLNTQNKPKQNAKVTRIAERYERLINADSACSVCYSSLIYALYRLNGRTEDKLFIGQGYRNNDGKDLCAKKTDKCVGIGDCTRGFSCFVPGCPPKATDIIDFLR
ncbi:MAG: DUF362 domain-containing protein [Lachnospiraceae bacterium]|jgi:uncharacterized protein (DUF362 family)|nr:DUF362 domain-containing protein [Lachnospiraceae bacterium]